MVVESWLSRAARTRPAHPAVGALGYAALDAAASAGARDLRARGTGPGDRIGLALPPGEAFAVALHAIWRAGAVAVPIDARLTDAERSTQSPLALLVDAPLGDGPAAVLTRTHDLGAVAAVIHTSGTTGAGKPIELTFGNWLWSALGSAAALGAPPGERWLCALPLSHVGGLSILVRAAIYGTTALVHERWDTERVVRALGEDGVTMVSVVATTLARLLDAGLEAPQALRCALVGGGPVPPALVERARAARVPLAQTYGLTEACSQVTTAAPGDTETDAGPPLFCTRVRIAPDGEIVVSGPTVAGAGELHTGDLGTIDAAGRLTVTGRKADTIVSGGENVAPTEVEAVLAAHPAVADAAVHGGPDPAWGEAVLATVVLRPGVPATEAELIAHCTARLARFKVPKRIAFADVLPRTASGKLLRRELG